MKVDEIQIDIEGRDPVSGLLARPRSMKALYVLAHGAGAGMRHAFMQRVAEALFDLGIGTMRYQFPYTEAGRKRPDTHKVLLATVRAAVDAAQRRTKSAPLLAGGKSMGGRMTSLAASQRPLPGVAGLVFLGFPLHAPGKPGTDRGDHLRDVDVPMLFVQGTRDKLADLQLLQPVLRPLGKRARLHVIEGGDHSLGVPKRDGRTADEIMGEVVAEIAAFAADLG